MNFEVKKIDIVNVCLNVKFFIENLEKCYDKIV